MPWDFAIILLFLGLAVPWLGYRRVRRLMQAPSITTIERLGLYVSTLILQWVITGLVLWRTRAHAIRPAQLGLSVPRPFLTATVSAVVSLLLLVNQLFAIRRLASRPQEIKGMIPQLARKIFPQNRIEQFVFVALVVTVAVCEETIYRGFVQSVFQDLLTGSVIGGVVLSAVFFSMAHVYQGRRGLISTFAIGLVFASVRAWTGSLVPSISAHFVADLVVGLRAPIRLRHIADEAEAHLRLSTTPIV